MHVLILPSWYPRYDGDPEGSFFRDQAHGLADAGLEVGVVFSDLLGPKRYFSAKAHWGLSVRQDGAVFEVRSRGFNWFPRGDRNFEWLFRRHARKAFKEYIDRRGKPDVIHVHSMHPASSVALEISSNYAIPFIQTEHSSYFLRKAALRRQASRYGPLAQQSAANIAVSQTLAEKLEAAFGGGWIYIPNTVSDRFFEQEPISRSPGPFRLISVAFLSKNKRMDLVIEVVSELRRRGRDVVLTILGEGSERAFLEALVSQLSLGDAVTFGGRIAIANMPAEMAKGDLLISASELETFGVTLIEAMALGIPVVATRSGGPDGIVTPEVGKLVDRWDAAELADAVEAIMDASDCYQRMRIRAHCQERYSAPVISARLASIYNEAVTDARR